MKRFLAQRLQDYQFYLSKNLPILNKDGDPLRQLNFDFEDNSSEFLDQFEQISHEDNDEDLKESDLIKSKLASNLKLTDQETNFIDSMKLSDKDIEQFLQILQQNHSFKGELVINNHQLTDETSIRIASILKKNQPNITRLALDKNIKFSYITGFYLGDAIKLNNTLWKFSLNNAALGTHGANRIIEAVKVNQSIYEYDFGRLTDKSLKYLITFLQEPHIIEHLSFGEDTSDPWTEDTKALFLNALRENPYNNQLHSIVVYVENIFAHHNFISEISITMQKNRKAFVENKYLEYRNKDLNTEHAEYYDEDNHNQNAFKFSVKTYMSNVIQTLLDEGLYFLEKERANMTRDEEIFKVDKAPINKIILEDLFKADGSLLVLARYMINKINKGEAY